jgi:hypothetical protein
MYEVLIENITLDFDWDKTYDHDFAGTIIFTENKTYNEDGSHPKMQLILGYEPGPNHISPFAGGRDDLAESANDTAMRELKEETADQLQLTKSDYQENLIAVLRKTKRVKGNNSRQNNENESEDVNQDDIYRGYIFILFIPDLDFETLNRDVQRSYLIETRPTYREVSKLCLINWKDVIQAIQSNNLTYLPCSHDNRNKYRLRDKAKDTMVWIYENYG